MLEDRYATDGLIRLDRIGFPDNGLPQAKVQGLVAALGSKPTLAVQGTTPDPTLTRLWVNTSPAVPRLLFSDGARWLDPSPQGLLPLPQAGDVLKFLRLNSTATALEYAPLDFSALVQATAVGNPSGVASLDSQGQVPVQQVPAIHRRAHFTGKVAGAIGNGTITVGLLSGNNFSIESASFKLGAGTATVQLFIAGSAVGTAIAVGTAVVKNPWSAVTQNAAALGLEMALVVTSAAGASDLLWAVNGAVLS